MNKKKSWYIILIAIATVVLGVIAVITAIRLYQLREEPVAPTAPEPVPAAELVEETSPSLDCTLTFEVAAEGEVICESKTAYRNDSRNSPGDYYLEDAIGLGETVALGEIVVFSINPGPSEITRAITVSDTIPEGLEFSEVLDDAQVCAFSSSTNSLSCSLTETDAQVVFTATVADDATGTITNIATVQSEGAEDSTCSASLTVEEAPPPACWETCTTSADCSEDLVCQDVEGVDRCVNSDCPEEEDCVCPAPSPTPSPTPTPTPSLTPTPSPGISPSPEASPTAEVELPEAGIILPTILATLGGIVLILLGLLL